MLKVNGIPQFGFYHPKGNSYNIRSTWHRTKIWCDNSL